MKGRRHDSPSEREGELVEYQMLRYSIDSNHLLILFR